MAKKKLDLFFHPELLDDKASAVITSVMMIPFHKNSNSNPAKYDGSINTGIKGTEVFDALPMAWDRDVNKAMVNLIDSTGVFEESCPVGSQLAIGRTISEKVVNKRYTNFDNEQQATFASEQDMISTHYYLMFEHICLYIMGLVEKYDVTIWVKDYWVEGQILEYILGASAGICRITLGDYDVCQFGPDMKKCDTAKKAFEYATLPFGKAYEAISFIYNKKVKSYKL